MEKPTENGSATGTNAATAADKMMTFRRRRLSFPRHHLSVDDDDDDDADDVSETQAVTVATNGVSSPPPDQVSLSAKSTSPDANQEKAQTFRKRRLSLTLSKLNDSNHHQHNDDNDKVSPGRRQRRRSSAASAASAGSIQSNGTANSNCQPPLQARTLHAAELLGGTGPPPSPAVQNSILYQHYGPLPPSLCLGPAHNSPAATDNGNRDSNGIAVPKWKTSHALAKTGDEHKLPFPRDIVGTYSCHGVEPVYDSGYDESEEETTKPANGGKPTIVVKPTTVAKINQDRGGVAFPYGNSPRTALFAVYDGHGQGGEFVSQFALHEIQRRLEKHSHFRKDLPKAFRETFLAVDEALENEPLIEPVFAGTTACVALLKGDTMTIANAGDSRAVIAHRHPTNYSLSSTDLTVDQNPDLPEEMQRILQAGGFVSPPPAPGLSARVWLDPNFTQIGLAMARSIGDHAVAPVGVIADPVVTKYQVGPTDEFLILASDGVWEFISSQDAVDIVGEHLDRGATKACQALIEAAAAKWHEEEGDYRDDITALVVCLQDLWP
jgi:serine/threonine protein phosphatase PrpC